MNLVLFLVFTAVSAYYYDDIDLSDYDVDFQDDNWAPADFKLFSGYKFKRSSHSNELRKRGGLVHVVVDPETGETYAPVEGYTVSESPDCEPAESPAEPASLPNPEQPDPEVSNDAYYESLLVGSIRGIPGINFPDYTEIPLTSFSCFDKEYMPGFYADLETGCQVFHVCWHHRRESFLCPIGTTFNQAILACDYWYSSNCSLAPYYYNVNAASVVTEGGSSSQEPHVGSVIDDLIDTPRSPDSRPTTDRPEISSPRPTEADLSYIMKFLPVKAKVTVYTEGKSEGKINIVAEASVGKKGKHGKGKPEVTTEEPLFTEYPTTRKPVVTEQPIYPKPTPLTQKPVVTEKPVYPKTTPKPVVTERPVYPKPTTLKPVVTAKPVYPETTQKPVVTERPVYPKTTPSTKRPVYPKPTRKPVVTEKPVYPKTTPSTPDPVVTQRPVYPKKPGHIMKEKPLQHKVHGGIDPSVSKIIDDVFDIAKQIVKEAGEFVPKAKWLVKDRRIPVVPKKPLAKLNPRFIVKPVSVEQSATAAPVHKLMTEKPWQKQSEVGNSGKNVKVEDIGFKPVLLPLKRLNMQLKVSPLTKKALTENYIKLWQRKVKRFRMKNST